VPLIVCDIGGALCVIIIDTNFDSADNQQEKPMQQPHVQLRDMPRQPALG
jgi:hypothetical protein